MPNSIYKINKGINKSIEFKGLKAQYIWYLGAGVLAQLVLFALLYLFQIPSLVCIAIIAITGSLTVAQVYKLSRTYGEHGLQKKLAYRQVPHAIRLRSRGMFRKVKSSKK